MKGACRGWSTRSTARNSGKVACAVEKKKQEVFSAKEMYPFKEVRISLIKEIRGDTNGRKTGVHGPFGHGPSTGTRSDACPSFPRSTAIRTASTRGEKGPEGRQRGQEKVAALIGADASEVIFTGGGSGGRQPAIKGSTSLCARTGRHVITTRIEHHAVMDAFGGSTSRVCITVPRG